MKINFTLLSLLMTMSSSAFAQGGIDLTTNHPESVMSDGTVTSNNTMTAAFNDTRGGITFQSDNADHAWVGMDLGRKCVITSIRIAPTSNLEEHALLQRGIFEGANRPDFMDAIPLHMMTLNEEISGSGQWVYYSFDVNVSRAFQYVRYVGAPGSYAKCSEITFYGYEGEGSETQFYQPTNLPLVVIHTETGNDPVDKINNINAISSVIYVSKTGKSKIVGDAVASTVRGRGNASWDFAKKPYRIKYDKKVEMPYGGGSFKKWTLLSNYGDKTLMRNMLAFDMSRRMEMPYTPYCQPVDLMLNGEYKGTYQLCDQLEVGAGRVDIDELKLKDVADDVITGGYFYEYDGNSKLNYYDLQTWLEATPENQAINDVGFYTARYDDVFYDDRPGNPVTIKSPDEDKMTQQQFDYLKTWLNEAENQIYHQSAAMNDYVDFETFARFFITSEFSGNTDTFYELYQYKKRGDKRIYFGPCWDYDIAYSNDYRTKDYLNNADASDWLCFNGGSFIENWTPDPWNGPRRAHMELFARALLNNARSQQILKENWAYVRTGNQVSNNAILALIDEYAQLLDESQKLNYQRWNIEESVHMNYDIELAPTYQAQLERVKNYVVTRMNFMDRKLNLGSEQTYALNMSSAGWSTLYLPFAFDVPEGLSVYSVVGLVNGTELNLEKVTKGRPNRAYLVSGAPGLYIFHGYGAPFEHKRTNGLLVGHNYREPAPDGSYVLQNNNGVTAFYRVNYDKAMPNIGVNRAYLWIPNLTIGSNAPIRFVLDENEETGIGEMASDFTEPVRIYDMAGHLLREITEGQWSESEILDEFGRGMYIIRMGEDSKKVMIGQ